MNFTKISKSSVYKANLKISEKKIIEQKKNSNIKKFFINVLSWLQNGTVWQIILPWLGQKTHSFSSNCLKSFNHMGILISSYFKFYSNLKYLSC